jgi:hypothetical protein
MELRLDLTPPLLDAALVERLTKLADALDGAAPGRWAQDLAEFTELSGTVVAFEEFQGIYGGDGPEAFVRRVLFQRHLSTPCHVSLAEMTEVVSRVMRLGPDHEFYLELFLRHCSHPSGSDLIFWPNLVAELPQDREPTAREIADLALRGN